MKKIYLIVVMAICSIASYAQISFGGQIGANLAMGHAKYSSTPGAVYAGLSNDPKPGFMIGVLAQVDFGKLAFRPELNFIQKGSKTGYVGDPYASKITLNYIEVPLNVVYNMDLGPGKLFFGLGPAVGIGLSGKDKYKDYNADDVLVSYKDDIKFDGKANASDNADHLKRVDVGANILVGYQLPMGVFAKIGFTEGLINIDPDDNSKYHNRGVSLCVGYMLGGGGKKKK